MHRYRLANSILNFPRFIKQGLVLLLDVIFCIVSTILSFYLRLGDWSFFANNSPYSVYLVAQISCAIALPIFVYFGLYREIFRHSGLFAISSLVKSVLIYSAPFVFLFSIYGLEDVPRTVGFIQPILLFILVASSRLMASFILGPSYRKRVRVSSLPSVLIYGAGTAGRQLAESILRGSEMRVVGFLDDNSDLQGRILEGKKIYSPLKLKDLVINLDIREIFLAIPSASRFRRNQIIKSAQDVKVSIRTLPSMADLVSGKVALKDIRPLDIDDLLGRDEVSPDSNLLAESISKKVVMVTGAGGSIGSELCRQVIKYDPQILVLVEQNEFALYRIHQELLSVCEVKSRLAIQIVPLLVNVVSEDRVSHVIQEFSPHIIFHAAAYKHVPLVESNIVAGIKNNVFGTLVMAKVAAENRVPKFVLISTDKAVRPTNVMGASKRLAEMVLQALSETNIATQFSMVRFGNVLNSSGSVVPKFSQQIKDGGPLTVTDFRMTRYFMTIPEAAQLVIQSSALATGGDVFLLDMGEPVKIAKLARKMIELSGLEVRDSSNPEGDIEISEIGLRPGEKLFEELLIDGNPEKTLHPKIYKAHEDFLSWDNLNEKLAEINEALIAGDESALLALLRQLVVGYKSVIDSTLSEEIV